MMIRLLVSLFILTSCAEALFGIGGHKNSSEQPSSQQPKTGLLSKIKTAIVPKKTSQPQQASQQPKTGIMSKLKNAISSKKSNTTTQQPGQQPKTGIIGKLKNAISSKKSNTTQQPGQDGTTAPKPGLLSRLKSGTKSLASSVQCTASKCAEPSFMTPQNMQKCLSTVALARTNINCSKSFITKFCQAGNEGLYASTCEIANEAVTQGSSGLGKLTGAVGSVKSSIECTAAKCSDVTFMNPTHANSCLPNVDRARTNINCSKAFVSKFCQTPNPGAYAATCQIANQAIQQGGKGLGLLTGIGGKVQSLAQCTAAYCSNPTMVRDDLYKCIGTPALVRQNPNCSNSYYATYCQKLRMPSQTGMAPSLPHGTEFCNAIAQARGEPGFGSGGCQGVISYRIIQAGGYPGGPPVQQNSGASGKITASSPDDDESSEGE